MKTKLLLTSVFSLLLSISFSQDLGLICDSISSTETSFQLTFQESFTITINYTGPNPGVKSGVYVTQKVEVEDNGVIESVDPPPFGQENCSLIYGIPKRSYWKFKHTKRRSKNRPDFSVNGKYIIKQGEMSTCELHEI
ncbi:MAG: hypothetical protein R3B93_05880 [Bacteroidia bacterium]